MLLSELSQSAELPIWFPIGIILVTIGMFFKIAAVPFHLGMMFMKGSYFDNCLNEHIKVIANATLFKVLTIMNADISPAFQLIIVIISMASTVGI
jgi:NADH-quinone oxidoreductase subunit N